MTVILPSTPLPQTATPKPIDAGGWQRPIGNGAIQRLDRPGNHMAIDVTTPRLKPEPDGRIWASRLLDAIGADVQFPWPQPGFAIGAPGSLVVDGAGQGGAAIALKGGTVGYVVREGQWFNLYDAAGRPYLMKASADATVGSDGKVIVTLGQPLSPRMSPANNSTANFTAPVIVGVLSGNLSGWTWQRAALRGLQFSIEERR